MYAPLAAEPSGDRRDARSVGVHDERSECPIAASSEILTRTYSALERRLKRQHRGYARRLRESEQPIADAGQTRHEAGRVNAQRRTTQVLIPIDALHNGARQSVCLDVPPLVLEHLSG